MFISKFCNRFSFAYVFLFTVYLLVFGEVVCVALLLQHVREQLLSIPEKFFTDYAHRTLLRLVY